MYKEKIKSEFIKVLDKDIEVSLDKPKQKEHGDLACNVAMKLAKELKKNPLEIANDIKEKISSNLIEKIEVARPGFINLVVSNSALAESLAEVSDSNENYGHAKKDKGRVLVEFVSANPTGDLHIGHGRQAAIGDTTARILDAAGYDVGKEFYINDYGEQMRNLAASALAFYKKSKGESVEWKEEYYPEETVDYYVTEVLKEQGDNGNWTAESIGSAVKEYILKKQKELLKNVNVEFDDWFSETQLHADGKVDEVFSKLVENSQSYESEGAIWFKAKELGDVRDRVIKRSDGRPTYLAADIAYHLNKLNRKYEKLINVWGADHHGQEVGLKAAITAVGGDGEKLEILFVQLVSLKKDGAEVKMSKRAGTVVTVEDLLSELSKNMTMQFASDAIRYFLIASNPNNRMVFDLDLAKRQDKENPVFYVQYAHARCCSIFRQIKESDYTSLDFSKPEIFMSIFDVSDKEYQATKDLILKILDFPEEVQLAATNRSGSRIATYLSDLATAYHQFYTVCRVITDNKELTAARLGLVSSTRITIANGLKLLGISAPDKM